MGWGGVSGTGRAARVPAHRLYPLVRGRCRAFLLAGGVTCAPLPEGGDRDRGKVTGRKLRGKSSRGDPGTRWLRTVPMAEKPESPDSSWVLAGGEGLPVETVGPERDLGSHGAEDEEPEEDEGTGDSGTAVTVNGAATVARHSPGPAGDPEERWGHGDVGAADGTAEPGVTDGGEHEEPDAEAEPPPCPDTPKAGPPTEEGSGTSSDDDMEGLLRRQQSHEPPPGPPRPVPAPHRGTPGDGDGLGVSKFLLGAAALVALGLLVISGGIYDPVDGPVESVVSRDVAAGEQDSPLPTDGNDSQPNPPLSDTGDPPSVQSVTQLLDKLAKENQEIRLLQAELQAQKDELQTLLRRSEGDMEAAEAQQRGLAAENARLRAALERDAAALRDARDELQRLRAGGAPGGTGGAAGGTGEPAAEPTVRRDGAERLAALRQELAGALERARGAGGLEGLVGELSALERRLERELEAEGTEPPPGPWKKPFKAEKKENKRHKRHDAPHEWEKKERGKPHGHPKDPRPPREHKAGKPWGKSSHGPPRHSPHELPPLSRYRAPQGCSGVSDCARKEGLEAFGVALEPVRKAEFLRLLEGFMEGLGWGGHFGGVAARLDGVFGADGAFAHDRLRFVDFVEDVEELLEELARREGGDEEAADGFEGLVRRHYGGNGRAGGKERGRRDARHHG